MKGSRLWIAMVLLATLAAAAAWGSWPRGADLRAFEPAGMARLETAMWRDCYEKR